MIPAAGAAVKGLAHTAASPQVKGGTSDNDELIVLLLVVSAAVIFIDHDRTGKPQSGNQFVALGIVGFGLLVLSRFWAEGALAFAGLFTLSVILNSPNGIPFISPSNTGNKTGIDPTKQGAGESPGINAVGGSTSGTGVQGPVTPTHPLNPAQ